MFSSGTKSVAAAGTAERLTSGQGFFCQYVRVQAVAANTGAAFVGGSDVDSTEGSTLNPTEATANDAVEFTNVDIADVWVDVATNGDDVSWFAVHDHPATVTSPLFGG